MAAQHAFSERGYRDTGIRDITARAGVTVALVNRYFGTKERLFEEALSAMLDSSALTQLARENFGEGVVDLLLNAIGPRPMALPMIMLASGDPAARAISHRLLEDLVYVPLARWFGLREGRVRAARFMIVSAGLSVYSQIYPLDVVAPAADCALREWLIREFQCLVE